MATFQETHVDLEAGCDGEVHNDHNDNNDNIINAHRHSTAISESEIVGVEKVVDLENGNESEGGDSDNNNKVVNISRVERDCRICHLSIDLTNQECENGIPIELGCCCKDDLAAAHKHCAEAWFKIKGNKTCEICGSVAQNVAGANEAELMEQWNEANDAMSSATPPGGTTTVTSDNRNFWQGHRFLNFLLACMVFAFVISWLFHFNVPS